MKPFSTFVLVVIIGLFTNCASIVSKSQYPISINTNPIGATISITNRKGVEVYKGTSPATVKLKSGAGYFKKAEYQVKFSSPRYAEKVISITFKLNGWYFGNLLIGGALGMLIIDPLTGAMWKIDNPIINESLAPTTASIETPTFRVSSINDIPDSMKEHLVKIN